MRPDIRGALVGAAHRLIAARGTAALTVREIATEAGLAVGVLYNHFGDKSELLALGLQSYVAQVVSDAGPPPGPAGAGRIDANLRAFVDRALAVHARILPAYASVLDQPAVLARSAALTGPHGPPLRAELRDYLAAEQRLGRIAPTSRPEVAAALLIGACHDLVLPHLYRGGSGHLPTPPGFADAVVTTVLQGIVVQ